MSSQVRFRKPKRWSSFVPPTAVPSTEFAGGQDYVKRWRLPPPLEVEVEKKTDPEAVTKISPPIEQVTKGDTEKAEEREEEMDDAAFLQRAFSSPRRDR